MKKRTSLRISRWKAKTSFMNFAWPQDFVSHPRTGWVCCEDCHNFATMFRNCDDFWNSLPQPAGKVDTLDDKRSEDLNRQGY